jgi:OOP family OmpA-OmpF porin
MIRAVKALSTTRRRLSGVALRASLVALSLAPAVARAQTPPFARNLDLQTFRPVPGPANFLTVAGSRVSGHGTPSFGAWMHYAHAPFTIYDATCPNATDDAGCTAGAVRSQPVASMATLHLQGAISLGQRVLISVDLPLVYAAGDAVDPQTARPVVRGGQPQTASGAGLGDPRVEARVRVAGQGMSGFGAAVAVHGNIPTGRFTGLDGRFAADDALSLGGRGIVDYRRGRFAGAVNLGGVWRTDTSTVLSTRLGSRMTWGVAASFDISPRLAAIAETWGASAFDNAQGTAMEANLAARYRLHDLSVTLGGGVGVLGGAGVPSARVLAGVAYAPVRSDQDADGVNDADDRCPNEPEDVDGYEDDDGCPERDNDGDGIADERDRCPDAPEDFDNFQDRDGCPDPDNDGDGVPDGYDSCPNDPEDRDGDRDEDGCPDNDRDRDGVLDDADRCPDDQEDTDGFEDTDGCPDPDNDRDGVPDHEDQCSEAPQGPRPDPARTGCPLAEAAPEADRDNDGVPDARDRCPDEAETVNGVDDEDGCPEAAAQSLVEITGGQIRILQQVNFANNSDRIVGRPSFDVLNAVTSVLRGHPDIVRVEVQGHTDNRGQAARNRSLSQRRAARVVAYLVEHGIDAGRLTARGFGPDQPIESNASPEGRARNRRVEFHIVEGPGASR